MFDWYLKGDLESRFGHLSSSADKKRKVLHDELNRQKTINDNLCKEFAEAVKSFTDWLGQVQNWIGQTKVNADHWSIYSEV